MNIPERANNNLSVCENMSRDSNKFPLFHDHLLDGHRMDHYNLVILIMVCYRHIVTLFTALVLGLNMIPGQSWWLNVSTEMRNDSHYQTGPGFEHDPQARVGDLNGSTETYSNFGCHVGTGFKYDSQATVVGNSVNMDTSRYFICEPPSQALHIGDNMYTRPVMRAFDANN